MVLVPGFRPAPFFGYGYLCIKKRMKKANDLIIKLLDIQNKVVYTLKVKTFSRVNLRLCKREKK